jgi:hypothetical protein
MRRGLVEALMSIGSVVLLLLALVAIDPRVREQISEPFTSRSSSMALATSAGSRVRDASNALLKAARDKSLANAPLLIFGLSASVLVLFMLRT